MKRSARPTNAPLPPPFFKRPRVFLSLTIFAAIVLLGVRMDNAVRSVLTGGLSHQTAQAATTEKTTDTPIPPKDEIAVPKASAPPDEDSSASNTPILEQLKKRRDELDKRENELSTKEAMLQVAELRADKKIKELEALKAQLQTLVGQADSNQQAQLENLVRIYETMKAKEAARIFEALDLPTLLSVVERMKPARVAVIMAEMAPEKAKEITVALTRRDQLSTK